MSIRALIVDDEPLARKRIKRLLADEADNYLIAFDLSAFESGERLRRV